MNRLSLFTTAGCHLCELAETELEQAAAQSSFDVEHVEIGDDDTLVQQYGTRIPVLRTADHRELNWPFNSADILALLNKQSTGK